MRMSMSQSLFWLSPRLRVPACLQPLQRATGLSWKGGSLLNNFHWRMKRRPKEVRKPLRSAIGNASRKAFETILCYNGAREKSPTWNRSIHQVNEKAADRSTPADKRQL